MVNLSLFKKKPAATETKSSNGTTNTTTTTSTTTTKARGSLALPDKSTTTGKQKYTIFFRIRLDTNSLWGLPPHLFSTLESQGVQVLGHKTWKEDLNTVSQVDIRDDSVVVTDNESRDVVVMIRKQKLQDALQERLRRAVVTIEECGGMAVPSSSSRPRGRRQKAMSTPLGGSLFGNPSGAENNSAVPPSRTPRGSAAGGSTNVTPPSSTTSSSSTSNGFFQPASDLLQQSPTQLQPPLTRPPRRQHRRQKSRSVPLGGSLFGNEDETKTTKQPTSKTIM